MTVLQGMPGRAGLVVKREAGTAAAAGDEAPCKGKLSPHRETFSGSASMTAIKAHSAQVEVQGQIQGQGPRTGQDQGQQGADGWFVGVWTLCKCGDGCQGGVTMRLSHAMQGPTSVGRA